MKNSWLLAAGLFFSLQLFGQQNNVLLIIVDDLKPPGELGKNQQILSPNLDKLGESATIFSMNY